MRYRDIFRAFFQPTLEARKSEWDNYAAAKTLTSSQEGEEALKTLSASELAAKPWYSTEMCAKACEEWVECLSWRYADDSCSLDHTAAMGQRIDAGIRMESGWMLERIAKLEDTTCEALPF